MSRGELAHVICYDLPHDRRRLKLSRLLDVYGRRVQYSVYEAVLDHLLFDKLYVEMKTLLVPEEDRVCVYRLCAACADRRLTLGRAAPDWPGREIVLVV